MSRTGSRLAPILPLASIVVVSQLGCSVFIPAHRHSNERRGERVGIRMLDLGAVHADPALRDGWAKAFGASLPSPDGARCADDAARAEIAGPAGALASIAVGFAVEYVRKSLQEEATLYEAQYGTRIADDKFWCTTPSAEVTRTRRTTTTTRRKKQSEGESDFTLDPPITEVTEEVETLQAKFGSETGMRAQRYYGIEVTRSVECPLHERIAGVLGGGAGGDGRCAASRIVYGLRPASDQQLLRIAPIHFATPLAKAKVPSDEWWSWLSPTFWAGKFARTPGSTVDVDVALEVEAYWKGKDQQLNLAKVATVETKIGGYQLDTPAVLAPDSGLGVADGGWLLGVPVSFDSGGRAVGLGTFTVRALVTERDTSNARKWLERGAEIVGEQGKRLQDAVAQ